MPLLHLTTTPPAPDPAAVQEDLRRIVQLIRKISGSTPGPSPDLGGRQDPKQHDKFLVEK